MACLCAGALYAETSNARLNDSAVALTEIMDAPDGGVPHGLLEKAQCIVIVPGLKKGAFIFGGKYAPEGAKVEGGSFELQVGGDASVAAGPVGRPSSAETDLQMCAEILTWSRSRGVFAGIPLQGATLRTDTESNKEMYRHKRTNQRIVMGRTAAPAGAARLEADLAKYSAQKE